METKRNMEEHKNSMNDSGKHRDDCISHEEFNRIAHVVDLPPDMGDHSRRSVYLKAGKYKSTNAINDACLPFITMIILNYLPLPISPSGGPVRSPDDIHSLQKMVNRSRLGQPRDSWRTP